MIVEAHYLITIQFMPGKGSGLNPVFRFWLNEEKNLHAILLSKMLEAAAQERWKIPIISPKFTGEDFISIVRNYKVTVIGHDKTVYSSQVSEALSQE